MRIFFDSEFTGLHRSSTLISLAFVAENGEAFYSEFTDYDQSQCDGWIKDNVLANTRWIEAEGAPRGSWREGQLTLCYGDSGTVRAALNEWLNHYDRIEIWADCPSWDWVLFCDLYGGALSIPCQIFYMPFDIATLFKLRGLDPDSDRTVFAGLPASAEGLDIRHNALYDARLTQACYKKLIEFRAGS